MIVERKTNPWLLEKLREKELVKGTALSSQYLRLIVEVVPDYTDVVADELEARRITVYRELITLGRYIPIYAPVEMIPEIQKIPYVVIVHYDMPVWIRVQLPEFPFLLTKIDPLLDKIRISEIEIPGFPFPPALPIPIPFIGRRGYEFWPTGETRKIIEAPDENVIAIKVAVLDTGAPWAFNPQVRGARIEMESTVPGEPIGLDGQGHGSWCTTCAFGPYDFNSRFGLLKPVASARNILHVKCLSNAGFGSTSGVIKAMEIACKWGAKVISMSLGGELQGPVDSDPCTKAVEILTKRFGSIFVIAAGNEGPDEWTIGSPAASPYALTVGSYSPKYRDVADFSSRGPSGKWYKDHPRKWEADLATYGENLIKPDCLAPGGGPVGEKKPVDLIVSGINGWFDGFYDFASDQHEAMRGTSMATPHCAGLVAILLDRVKILSVNDVKGVLRIKWAAAKDIARGYGLIKYGYWG